MDLELQHIHVHAAKAQTWKMQHGQVLHVHVHDHAALTWKKTQQGHVHDACPDTCCMSQYMLLVHVHAACPCPGCMSMFMLNVFGHVAGTWICSMDLQHVNVGMDVQHEDMDMHHGYGPAAWT
jgi:hypothetical protein